MFPSIFRILILFTLICSIGPWGGPGITDTVVNEQVNAALLEQKADEVLPLNAQTTISGDIGQSETGYHFVATEDGYTARVVGKELRIYLSVDSIQVEARNLSGICAYGGGV
jgi:hypothetical protein